MTEFGYLNEMSAVVAVSALETGRTSDRSIYDLCFSRGRATRWPNLACMGECSMINWRREFGVFGRGKEHRRTVSDRRAQRDQKEKRGMAHAEGERMAEAEKSGNAFLGV